MDKIAELTAILQSEKMKTLQDKVETDYEFLSIAIGKHIQSCYDYIKAFLGECADNKYTFVDVISVKLNRGVDVYVTELSIDANNEIIVTYHHKGYSTCSLVAPICQFTDSLHEIVYCISHDGYFDENDDSL